MEQIQINNKYLEFKDGEIFYCSPTLRKIVTYDKDNEKSFVEALMQIINLIENK